MMIKQAEVHDIRDNVSVNVDEELKRELIENMRSSHSIPSLFLYDAHGLEIFEKISTLPTYYPFWAELEILKDHANSLAKDYVVDGSMVLELGSGPLHKTSIFLEALNTYRKNIKYYALDLSAESLSKSLSPLVDRYDNIKCAGLYGTYNDSIRFFQNFRFNCPKLVIWLGASIGNMTRDEAADFLSQYRLYAMNPGDLFLCGIDRRNSYEDVIRAYDGPETVHSEFALNALTCADNLLGGKKILDKDGFEFKSAYYIENGQRVSYLRAKEDVHIGEPIRIDLRKGEQLRIAISYKYNQQDIEQLLTVTGFTPLEKWTDKMQRYDLHLWKA